MTPASHCRHGAGPGIQTVPITNCAVTTPQDAIDDVLAHYQRRSEAKNAMAMPPEPSPLRYRPEALDVLFGDSR